MRRRLRGGLPARSFAFRLGLAFALVALVGASATALVVNAAFASRFRQYAEQQQHARVTGITAAAGQSYAGNQQWDLRALQALSSAAGTASVRILTPSGQDVWRWDGHEMSWNGQWMEDDQDDQGGDSGTGSGGGQGDCGSWDHCGPGNMSDSRESGDGHSGMPDAAATAASAVVWPVADTTPTPGPSSPSGLGTAQRLPMTSGGKVVGTALVRLPKAASLPDAIAFRDRVVGMVLLGGATGAVLAAALGTLLARHSTRPVRRLTAAARALAAGDRHTRLDTSRGDEFGEMTRAFNTMADAAEGAERLRQEFASDVAHELRTPLTILRSQVEGMRVGVLDAGPDALTSLDEEVQRMTRLVADLQILGAADAAGFTLERAPTPLQDLAEQAVREFAGLFEASEIQLHTRLDPVTACVDRDRVRQILANLLSNALKFTPAGGQVRVDLFTEAKQAVLCVGDSGPGIPTDELPHVFDRFFRGRGARPAGSGIGLAVVRELTQAHGGTVQVSSAPGQGTTFTVRLPLEATSPPNRFHTDPSQPPPSVKS
ncbi:HAMP domain-containing sensor histidine kinase [Streptomyces sp. CdTB01]|uniref:sensor histidine kinase n=1 Tax=Streptomyces sp. CdTB01 TaxID=1725411 RepID=UPI00073A8359|nr:HAMP domain-containing sensor histidine kinase [Streptomyces sp. CdTB01]ALV33201.1 hypothetical protein AS200_15045 [Streptomyces sp. CdTB01]